MAELDFSKIDFSCMTDRNGELALGCDDGDVFLQGAWLYPADETLISLLTAISLFLIISYFARWGKKRNREDFSTLVFVVAMMPLVLLFVFEQNGSAILEVSAYFLMIALSLCAVSIYSTHIGILLNGIFLALGIAIYRDDELAFSQEIFWFVACVVIVNMGFWLLILYLLKNNSDIGFSWKDKIGKSFAALTRDRKAFISFVILWALFVNFKTFAEFELFGIHLDRWDIDFYILNLALPPLILFVIYKLYFWVQAGGSSSNR